MKNVKSVFHGYAIETEKGAKVMGKPVGYLPYVWRRRIWVYRMKGITGEISEELCWLHSGADREAGTA